MPIKSGGNKQKARRQAEQYAERTRLMNQAVETLAIAKRQSEEEEKALAAYEKNIAGTSLETAFPGTVSATVLN